MECRRGIVRCIAVAGIAPLHDAAREFRDGVVAELIEHIVGTAAVIAVKNARRDGAWPHNVVGDHIVHRIPRTFLKRPGFVGHVERPVVALHHDIS